MAPKLTSCDMFGILLKYVLSTEGGFVAAEKAGWCTGKWWAATPTL